MTYTASCHCGKVVIEFRRKPPKLTQCNCSICRRYGALWAYFQRRSIVVRAADKDLQAYSWRNRRFQFFHCRHCGCVTHYERTARKADGSDMAAINLRNIDKPGLLADVPVRMLDGAGSWHVLSESPQPDWLQSPRH